MTMTATTTTTTSARPARPDLRGDGQRIAAAGSPRYAGRPRRSSSFAAGFTLIEVMLVMAILGTLTTLMWSSFSQASRSKKRVEASQERTHTVRVALLRMAREIEMAFLSENNTGSAAEPRTRLVAISRPDVDELMFSSFAHQRLRGGVPESDTSTISYYGQHDPEDRRVLNLMRRETRRLQAADPATVPGDAYILCPDIVRLKIGYYDYKKKEWHDDWDTKLIGRLFLPSHVRVALTVLDERGKEVTFATDARIQMTELVGYR